MPTKEIIVTPGNKMPAGTCNTRLNSLTMGTFRISNTTLAINREAISPQTTSGRSLNNSGPGVIFSVISKARRTAVVPEPGTPNVNIGTSAPPAAALLPASGAATPFGSPVPKLVFSLAIDFSAI